MRKRYKIFCLIQVVWMNCFRGPENLKRIFTTKWYDVSDAEDIEATVGKAVRLAVEDILEMEKQVFAQLGNK